MGTCAARPVFCQTGRTRHTVPLQGFGCTCTVWCSRQAALRHGVPNVVIVTPCHVLLPRDRNHLRQGTRTESEDIRWISFTGPCCFEWTVLCTTPHQTSTHIRGLIKDGYRVPLIGDAAMIRELFRAHGEVRQPTAGQGWLIGRLVGGPLGPPGLGVRLTDRSVDGSEQWVCPRFVDPSIG